MGCCLCLPRATAVPSNDVSEGAAAVAVGRNQPLKPEKPKWTSDRPMTEEQLRSQRDQFWDTAPAFEGHKEIWDALKGAAYALESGDYLLAQAIVDGANIMLPTGSLEDCYDELGSRYQLPVYVLSAPCNLQLDASDVDETAEKLSSPLSKKRKRGSELPIRLQLSTGPILRLTLRTHDSVLSVRQQVAAMSDVNVSAVRLFFAGKQLTDNTRLKDAGLRKNYTVQAVLSDSGLSKTSLQIDGAGDDVAELPQFATQPSAKCLSTSPTSTEALSPEEIQLSVAVVPSTGSVDDLEPMQTSVLVVAKNVSGFDAKQTGTLPAVVRGTDSGVLAPVDFATSSAVSEDV